MGIALGFVPFIVFAVASGFGRTEPGLVLAAAAALGLLVRHGRPVKLLEAGSAALFTALAVAGAVAPVPLGVAGVRLVVDAGLLAIVLASLAVGQPFTLQYAREQVPPEVQASPLFFAVNWRISGVWAAAFAIGLAAEAALLWLPAVPPAPAHWAGWLALVGAIRFTTWYPRHVRARAGLAA